MPLFEFLDILQKVQVQLQLPQGNDGQKVFKKFETVLNKNNGLTKTGIKNTLWRKC